MRVTTHAIQSQEIIGANYENSNTRCLIQALPTPICYQFLGSLLLTAFVSRGFSVAAPQCGTNCLLASTLVRHHAPSKPAASSRPSVPLAAHTDASDTATG